MARRVYGWFMAALLALPVTIKTIEVLESLRPHRKDYVVRFELPDEDQHGHAPTFAPPSQSEPPFVNNSGMLEAANRAVRMSYKSLRNHPAYLGSASHFPFPT